MKTVKLTRNGQIVLLALFVASLIFGGAGYAQSRATQAAYEEQSKQMELYKEELNEVQSIIQENTSIQAKYECMQVERDQLQKQVEELSK